MRLKLGITALLFALLVSSSHAECSKSEVMKLIDKGFSKTEINSICDIKAKSTAILKPKSKWITPSKSTCRAKGGRLYKGICEANWQQAKAICRASSGRLPSLSELKKVIRDCGGNDADTSSAYSANRDDISYQSCYKQKGFYTLGYYWSSSSYASNNKYAWFESFEVGNAGNDRKTVSSYVRCVRAGQ